MLRSILKSLVFVGTMMSVFTSGLAVAQSWPEKPVRLVVPFSAGGVADTLARLVGQGLSDKWQQSVVVENVSGAGGNIGMGRVVRAPADGYTIILAPNGNMTINQHLFNQLPVDVEKDVTPVTILADSQNVLIVSPKLGAKTLQDLLRIARERPEGITYGSPGVGSTQHLAGALLGMQAGVKVLHVPYKGFSPAINDVIAGEIDMLFLAVATAAPFVQSGQVLPLAIAGAQPAAILPNVLPITKQGFPEFDAVSWYSLIVRKGTPEPLVRQLHSDIQDVLKANRDRIVALGLTPSGKGLDEFAALARDQSARWGKTIDQIGIKKQ